MEFDELVRRQEESYNNILKLKENFKKDGKERKTVLGYFTKRLDTLESLYSEFKLNDENLLKQHDKNKNHQYWTTTRIQAREIYTELFNTLKQTIENWISSDNTSTPAVETENSLSKTSRTTNEDEHNSFNPSNCEITLGMQYIKGAELMRTIRNIRKDLDNEGHKKSYLTQKLQNINSKWSNIIAVHPEVVYKNPHDIEYIEKYDEWETQYDNMALQLDDALEELQLSKPASVQSTPKVHLPKIDIPKFNGNYLQWIPFRDIFCEIVHNNKTLPKITKMHYLKSHLVDQAAGLLNTFKITEDNYIPAWNTLQQRYDNKRLLVSTHIKRIITTAPIQSDAASLRKLVDEARETMQCINNLGINTTTWDPIILELLLPKLDIESHKLYEQQLENPKEIPSLDKFFDFLENHFQSLEMMNIKDNKSRKDGVVYSTYKQRFQPKGSSYAYHNTIQDFCRYCKGNHSMTSCINFKNLAPTMRNDFATRAELCKRCLKHLNHQRCDSKTQCDVCKASHHTLLHQYTPITTMTHQEMSGLGLLATAVVKVKLNNGREEFARVFIDSGSQATYIDERTTQRLGLNKQRTNVVVSGIGNNTLTANRKTSFILKPRFKSEFEIQVKAYVLPKLTRRLPNEELNISDWKHINNIIWADPEFNKPASINILLGMDYIADILLPEIKRGRTGPTAQRTKLGWIMFGAINSIHKEHQIQTMISTVDTDIKRFWEIEEVPASEKLTNEQARCEELYREGCKRLSDGSYEVKLPLKEGVVLGASKKQVVARYLQIENKFKNNPKFKHDYQKFMAEYMELGHMVPSEKSKNLKCYLPHHAVQKESSTTTKFRVVFDASMPTSTGVSLNDAQIVGPTIQQDLFSIILRWRKHKYVFTADIEKMYRQIKVADEHQDLQTIVWRDNPNEELKEFKLTTVTYGTSSAPYLAIRTLHQLAIDERASFPTAYEVLKNDFYVDDVLSGANSLDKTIMIQNELIQLLACGGFNLRKWCSNDERILSGVPKEKQELGDLEIKENQTIKTLGIYWDPKEDAFSFKTPAKLKSREANTKRNVLSNISKIFDPLGWISPVTIKAKILMQTIWESGIGWDEKMPPHLEESWIRFEQQLHLVNHIKIPRWIGATTDAIELHGFCDASEKAYAAVVYSKSKLNSGEVKITMLTSKTRVAPLKKINIPRLELCGALLLSKLLKSVQQSIAIPTSVYAYTDSTITLAWIQGPSSKWKTFVGNRVAEIQEEINPKNWFHVRSEDNPADAASRGLSPSEIQNHTLWWSGPTWLRKTDTTMQNNETFFTQEEIKKIKITCLVTTHEFKIWEKFSSLTKLVRSIAYMKRFVNNSRCKEAATRKVGMLSTEELRKSRESLICMMQAEVFSEEIRALRENRNLNKRSQLLQLNPFIDEYGVLRVGGRIKNSMTSFEIKHPIILPKKHHITRLIIEDAHAKTLHGGCQLVLYYIRQQYWIINARQVVRTLLYKCVRCYRFKTTESTQLMGELPAARVTPSRPFTHTGIDYAGPINLKSTSGRSKKIYKSYIAVFVCLATRAVHLEVVSDLTTNTFLAALRRFTSRRGICSHIYSDCGTTFKGADKQLKADIREFNKNHIPEIVNIVSNDGINWHFNAPATPHAGGLWEAAVKSAKYHLKRIVAETILRYEEMATLLNQIEACLNSRPLCATSWDIDTNALTPGHFLIGEPLLAVPSPVINEEAYSLSNRWRLTQKLAQDFWKIWSSEYLTSLQKRMKWQYGEPNIKIGDIVLIKEPNLPPTQWLLGKIDGLHPGNDGKVRVVTVRCKGNKSLKRPIQKICVLPIDDNNQNNIKSITSGNKPNQQTILRRSPRFHQGPLSMLMICLICIGFGNTLPTKQNDKLTVNNIDTMEVADQSRPVVIQQFQSNPGIFFENIAITTLAQEEWKIIVHYDLQAYWFEQQQLRSYVKHLTQLCSSTREFASNIQLCQFTMTYLQNQLSQIEEANNIIKSNKRASATRRRRALANFVGTLAHDLFGVLDEEWVEDYESKIKSIDENEKHLMDLLKEQTSITESTLNLYKRDMYNINQQIVGFQNRLQNITQATNNLTNEIAQVKAAQLLTELILNTLYNLLNYQDVQRELLNIIIDTHQGKINPLILTTEQLREQLNIIHQHTLKTLSVPGSDSLNEISNVYKFMSARVRVTSSYLLIEVKIPLVNDQKYQVYKLFPVPTRHEEEYIYIKPTAEYLAINEHKDRFYSLTESEFNNCHIIEEHNYWCANQHTIYTAQSNKYQCEISTLRHSMNLSLCQIQKTRIPKQWIKLHQPNSWIFFMEELNTMDVICGSKITTVEIKGAGILKLKSTCVINHKGVIRAGYHTRVDHLNNSFLPPINISTQIPRSEQIGTFQLIEDVTIRYNNSQGYNELQQKINQLKVKEVLRSTTTTHHDIHQYAVAYGTLVIVIILFFIYIIKTHRKRKVTKVTAPAPLD